MQGKACHGRVQVQEQTPGIVSGRFAFSRFFLTGLAKTAGWPSRTSIRNADGTLLPTRRDTCEDKQNDYHRCVARFVSPLFYLLIFILSLAPQTARAQATPDNATEMPQRATAYPSAKTLADLPPAALPAISSTLGRDDAQYGMRKTADGYSARNAPNHLAAHYAAKGVEIGSQNANVGFEFQGWGYGEHPANKNKAAVSPSVNANRVEYRRGALTEWYVNGPLGIEQGFTISQPPAALPDSNHDALDIALRLRGNLSASVEPGRHALALRDQKGAQALRYGPLLAYDASGRELESWMEVQDGSLRLRVNTAGARYPIIVDPWVQAAQLSNSLGVAAEGFGRSVAVGANTVVVGASGATIGSNASQGAVYVFVEPATGWAMTSTFTAELTASDGAAGDGFGISVGINGSGNTVVVGASGSSDYQGAVYVFVEPTNGWASEPTTTPFGTQSAKLTESDGAAGDDFGSSVGIDESGDTVVAGFFVSESSIYDKHQGAAYVFVEPTAAGGWVSAASETQTAKLTASDGTQNDAFGFSVGINESGTTVVVGAMQATVEYQYQGAAYVFVKPTAAGGWASAPSDTQTAKLTASDGTYGSYLGWSVGISESGGTDTVVTTGYAAAAVYVFVEPTAAGGWASAPSDTQTAELTPYGGAKLSTYGSSVGISGNTVVVGAPSAAPQGAAYVFVEPTVGGWVTTSAFSAELSPSGAPAGYVLGSFVGISGNTVVATASGNSNQQGAAYVFTESGTGGTNIVTTTAIMSTTSTVHGEPINGNYALESTPTMEIPVTVYYTVQPTTSGNPTPTGGTVTVTDGFTTNPDSCTGPLTNGAGSCQLNIMQLGGGSTALTATYSPAPSSGFLPSTSAPFTENIVEILECGAAVSPTTVRQGASNVTSFTVCLAGNIPSELSFVYLNECIPNGQCHVTDSLLPGTTNVYVVSVTITTTFAGCFGNPTGNGCGSASGSTSLLLPRIWRWPRNGPWWPLALFALAALLATRLAFLLVRHRGRCPRLAYSAGLILALVLGGISGCTSPPPVTPVGTYTVNVTVQAGGFSIVVPVPVQVTQ